MVCVLSAPGSPRKAACSPAGRLAFSTTHAGPLPIVPEPEAAWPAPGANRTAAGPVPGLADMPARLLPAVPAGHRCAPAGRHRSPWAARRGGQPGQRPFQEKPALGLFIRAGIQTLRDRNQQIGAIRQHVLSQDLGLQSGPCPSQDARQVLIGQLQGAPPALCRAGTDRRGILALRRGTIARHHW